MQENIDIDMNFSNLTRNQIIKKYLKNVHELKDIAVKSRKVRSVHFDNFISFQYFQQNENNIYNVNNVSYIKNELVKQIMDRKRKILFWTFYLLIALLFISYKNEASTIFLRNIQIFIYPGMKLWRKMTLPIIKSFPGLTGLYDESCLIMNPFFQVDDLNCEPCVNVVNVLDLTNIDKTTDLVPFVFKINQASVTISDLYDLYNDNRYVFQSDAFHVQSSNLKINNLDQLFMDFNQTKTDQIQSHSLWRCNRMAPARLLRQLFVRPERLPNTGISLERYISIDTPNAASYSIPDAECSNMYIQQILGTRTIVLMPTIECRHKCRTISVRLPQSFVLSYNWWYWKPISAPDALTRTESISLIGSYC